MSVLIKLVPVILDRERHLRLTHREMKQILDVTGINLLKKVKAEDMFSVGPLTQIMFICLKWEDPTLTLEALEEMFDYMHTVPYMTAIGQLFSDSAPDAKIGDTVNPQKLPTG